MAIKYVQSNTLYLAGSGVIIGATTITLTTFTDIYANVLTMADFGTKGYITLEPDTTNEEAASFTGVTANANGTYTLTGVKTMLAKSPYTETAGLVRGHSGGTKVVITDNVGFWNTFLNLNNTGTVEAVITFDTGATPIITDLPVSNTQAANKLYVDTVAIAGAPDASNVTKGITKLSVAAVAPTIPIAVGDNDPRVPTQGENDALVGNNTDVAVGSGNKFVTQTGLQHSAEIYATSTTGNDTYVVTLSPAPTSYTAGMEIRFKPDTSNTGAASLNVNGLGAKTIVKYVSTTLADNDILSNQIVVVIYDGTNFILQTPLGNAPLTVAPVYVNGDTSKNAADASAVQNIAHGLGIIPKKVRITAITSVPTTPGGTFVSQSAYNGTTQSSCSTYLTGAFGITTSNTFTLNAAQTNGTQTGVVTFDATNIIITWTKTNSPTGSYIIVWEANS